jgi:hypothetical protein
VATGDGITINPTGVEEFGTRLRAEVDKTIVPASDRIRQAMYAYPVFGQRSGSPAVQAAATRYYAQMRDAIAFLDDLIHNTNTMIEATRDAVAAYRAGDDVSAATMAQIVGGASAKTINAEREAARADRESGADLHRGIRQ